MKTLLKTSKSFSATSFKNRHKLFNVFIKAFAIHGIQLYLTRYSFAKFCKFCIFILIFVNDVVLVFLLLALTYFAPFSSVSIVDFERTPVYWGISIAFVFVFNAFLCLYSFCVQNTDGKTLYYDGNTIQEYLEKQPPRGVLGKRCSENMQRIYRRAPMPKYDFSKAKCDFNKVALKLHFGMCVLL